MKKLLVLFMVSVALLAAYDSASAFTLKEHLSGVKAYVAALS